MKRIVTVGMVAFGLAACGGQTVAERCHTYAIHQQARSHADAVAWADNFINSLPGPVPASTKASLIAGDERLAKYADAECLANPSRFLR